MNVQAYRNLNKPGVQFSIRHAGRVIGYQPQVFLADVTFKHATEKQLKAVRTGNRQVCQWLKGELLQESDATWKKHSEAIDGKWKRMSCDPKTSDGFIDTETGIRLDSVRFVRLSESGSFYVK